MLLPPVLRDLLNLPTAPFVEDAVMSYVVRAVRGLENTQITIDRHGNVLARYRHEPRDVPAVIFTAHTDHPGFCATRMRDERTLLADFRGWVEPEYFVGTRVRFHSGGRWIAGEVTEITKLAPVYGIIGRTGRPEQVAVRVEGRIEPNSPGMWDLPDAELRDGLVFARGCDDIAGVAAMIALLERLSQKNAHADVYCLFTRAEEVGFVGAIAAARDGFLPHELPVVAIETSKALVNARIGDGPILRVGDKTSIFTPAVTAFCDRVGKDRMARNPEFKYQRKLMDGGTCESTAYMVYGYAATGMCTALGNYHNMDTDAKRIASEFISLADWNWMVDYFEALALDEKGFGVEESTLRDTLDKRFDSYLPLLERRLDLPSA